MDEEAPTPAIVLGEGEYVFDTRWACSVGLSWKGLRTAVVRASVVARWLWALLNLGPDELAVGVADGKGEGDPRREGLEVPAGAVGLAVVVRPGSGSRGALRRPARPRQRFESAAEVSTSEDDLPRLEARRLAIAIHLDV